MSKRSKASQRRQSSPTGPRANSSPADAPALSLPPAEIPPPAPSSAVHDEGRTDPASDRGKAGAGFRPYVAWAVLKRDFMGYFSNPAGYVFITLFVLVSSWAAFCLPVFFADNLADLHSLNTWMPYLLLFFIPAVTMNIWAEERRLGTDELLLTLPARDEEIVLGKYLAALGIYTIALIFSLSHVAVLYWLGDPDPGVLFSTYLGYWLMGAMLIAIGMVASLLSSNATVAFILGGLFAALPVFTGLIGSFLASSSTIARLIGSTAGPRLQHFFDGLSIAEQFRDFGKGVITLSGTVYFLVSIAAMIYLTMVLLGRRHWAGGRESGSRLIHSIVRVAALVVALTSLTILISHYAGGVRADASVEQLSSLSDETRKVLKTLKADRPVVIQAYYSPEVPREYVTVKSDLLGKLREYAAAAGDKIRLNLVEVERFSPQARAAEKRFGIEPRPVFSMEEGRQSVSEIFLGVAFTSGLEEVVIPFFDKDLPVEYELTRSIRVVAGSGRKKIGIVNTDAKMLGGFDFGSMDRNSEWAFVTELKKQYDVTSVSADMELPRDTQVLIVPQPSSMTQRQIDNLTKYVKSGGPALLMLDPFPNVDPTISPLEPRIAPGGPFGGGPQPEPKGDLSPLLDLLGIEWPQTEIVWNDYNPHPKLNLPREVVFIGRGRGNDAFNDKQIVSSGLQEIVFILAGYLRPKAGPNHPEFIPLLRTDSSGGTHSWTDIVNRNMMGISGFKPPRRYIPGDQAYTLAALIEGPAPRESSNDPKSKEKKKTDSASQPARMKVIAVADLDMISDEFFRLRRNRVENLELDNVTFMLNCVDVLAGDDQFVSLRKRRARHRTLTALEQRIKVFESARLKKEKEAEEEAVESLAKAQKRIDEKVEEVRKRPGLDERTRELMIDQIAADEKRKLENEIKVEIEDKKRREIEDAKADAEQAIRQKQSEVKALAVTLPPLLPLALGLVVFGVRANRENRGANPLRLQ